MTVEDNRLKTFSAFACLSRQDSSLFLSLQLNTKSPGDNCGSNSPWNIWRKTKKGGADHHKFSHNSSAPDKYVKFALSTSAGVKTRNELINDFIEWLLRCERLSRRKLMNGFDRSRWNHWIRLCLIITTTFTMNGITCEANALRRASKQTTSVDSNKLY